jgi:hypothetical protein
MILKIIHPMLIAMNIWPNSKVVLLRSKKHFGFSPSYSNYNQSAAKKAKPGKKNGSKETEKGKTQGMADRAPMHSRLACARRLRSGTVL